MNAERIVGGTWKFDATITKEVVESIAREWVGGKDKDQYLEVHMRRVGDIWYIGFQYLLSDSKTETYRRFLNGLLHSLKLRLGTAFVRGKPQPRGVKGWSVSAGVIKIK